MKIAINGFGRIGRSVFKVAMERKSIEVVAINVEEPLDLAQPWAESLGLTMPLGIYGPEIAEAFPFKKPCAHGNFGQCALPCWRSSFAS